jgi:hypothetical protein
MTHKRGNASAPDAAPRSDDADTESVGAAR